MSRAFTIATAIAFAGMFSTVRSAPRACADNSVDGRWNGKGNAHLLLREGELHGSDGCNGITGSYAVDGSTVTFVRGPSTLMACPGVDTWLRAATRATIDGATMTVFGRDGREIGILSRGD